MSHSLTTAGMWKLRVFFTLSHDILQDPRSAWSSCENSYHFLRDLPKRSHTVLVSDNAWMNGGLFVYKTLLKSFLLLVICRIIWTRRRRLGCLSPWLHREKKQRTLLEVSRNQCHLATIIQYSTTIGLLWYK